VCAILGDGKSLIEELENILEKKMPNP